MILIKEDLFSFFLDFSFIFFVVLGLLLNYY